MGEPFESVLTAEGSGFIWEFFGVDNFEGRVTVGVAGAPTRLVNLEALSDIIGGAKIITPVFAKEHIDKVTHCVYINPHGRNVSQMWKATWSCHGDKNW